MSAALKYEPLFLSEDQEREELEQALGQVAQRTPAEIDSFASELLGSLGRCEADLQRYTEAENAEIARIRFRYARFKNTVESRRTMLEGAIKALAEQQDFGSKKSRETANGTYGRRTTPVRIEIMDQKQLCDWAQGNAKDFVTETYSVTHKDASRYYAETGIVAPGTKLHEPQEICFARPDIKGPHSGLSQ
jgi:hypothetical protein